MEINEYIQPFKNEVKEDDLMGVKTSIIGHIDLPSQGQVIQANSLMYVSGWLCAEFGNVESLILLLNGKPLGSLTYGYRREDINDIYPGNINCGFQGNFYVDGPKRNFKLSILVRMEDGLILEVLPLRLKIHRESITFSLKQNLLILLRAACLALTAAKNRRLPLSPKIWIKKFIAYRNQSLSIYAILNVNHNIKLDFNEIIFDPYKIFCVTNRITEKLRAAMVARSKEISNHAPLISIITPIYNTPHQFLREMIESVLAQIYPRWELCLADDASSDQAIREIIRQYAQNESRIKFVFREHNGHISVASNDALSLASGDYVALLDHDDLLAPDALLHFADSLVKNPELDWMYSDEDKVDEKGVFYDPAFKGVWNPEMALTHNYTHHLSVIRKDLVLEAGGFRRGYEGAQDLDLFLRVSELTSTEKIKHIPFICYHWRSHSQSTASNGAQKEYIFERAKISIEDALRRRKIDASPFLPKSMRPRNQCLYQLEWPPGLLAKNSVTIIIPTRDRVDLLSRCITSLRRTVDSRYVKVIIVNDNSELKETKIYLDEIVKDSVFDIKVIDIGERSSFNYSRLVNIGVRYATTDLVLHFNNDIEAISSGWLEDMVGWITIEKVGVVGAKLIYPNNKIQHAGVIVGPHGGLADHLFHQQDHNTVGYGALLNAARNVSAVTGACLLTKKDLYLTLNGFDEDNFAVEYNDVDYCMRVIAAGQRIVYTPQAMLKHITSASRGGKFNPQEHINFVRKYEDFIDPFFSNSLDIEDMNMQVDRNHYLYKNYVPKLKILFLSHNFDLGGAPIVLFELAKNFKDILGCEVTVISTKDGLLRTQIEKSDIGTKIITDLPEINSSTAEELKSYLIKKGSELNVKSYDLIIANTLVTFWGVTLAKINAIPAIWHIHESVNLIDYMKHFSHTSMHKMFKKSFVEASKVIFQSNITRSMYSNLNLGNNFITINGGLQMKLIHSWRKANFRNDLRKKYGFSEDDLIISIIGTTCERKGQHVFLDAISKFYNLNKSPGSIKFLIVGGISGPYVDSLNLKISKNKLKNVYIFFETEDIYDFFQLSDAFVCASFIESFPMVILLAMAFELPIFSTNVFGIPEIITDGVEGRLFRPGDSNALSKLLNEYVTAPEEFSYLAKNAHAKCWRLFNNPRLAKKHIEVALHAAMLDINNEA